MQQFKIIKYTWVQFFMEFKSLNFDKIGFLNLKQKTMFFFIVCSYFIVTQKISIIEI